MQILEGHVLMDMFLKIYSKLLCKSKAWGQSHLLIIEGITRNLAFLSNRTKTLQKNILVYISVCYSPGPAEGCTVSPF